MPNISIPVSEDFKRRFDDMVYKKKSKISTQGRIALVKLLQEFEEQQEEKSKVEGDAVAVVTSAPLKPVEPRFDTAEKRLCLCKQAWNKLKAEDPTNSPTPEELEDLVLELGSGLHMHPALARLVVREGMPLLEGGNGHG